jgi:hypothetical protein
MAAGGEVNSWSEFASSVGLTAFTAGAVLAGGWALIKVALEKKIEESVKHGFAVSLDQQKTENAIIVENVKQVSAACNELGLLVDEITESLITFQEAGGPGYTDRLMHDLHPKFKSRYARLRPRFEVNDVFSAYSLMLDRLTHAQNVREILGSLERKNRGNVRFLYGKMWLTVAEVSRSIYRVSTSYEFWNPKQNYGERADRWAEHDLGRINDFLKSVARERDFPNSPDRDFSPFYISLEEEHGRQRFWLELPPPVASSPPSGAVER